MSCAEDEAVASEPVGLRGLLFELLEDSKRDGSRADRHAGMAALCLLYGVRTEGPDGVYSKLIDVFHDRSEWADFAQERKPTVQLYRRNLIKTRQNHLRRNYIARNDF